MDLIDLTNKTINCIKGSESFIELKGVFKEFRFDNIRVVRSYSNDWIRVYKNNEEIFLVSNHGNGDPKRTFYFEIIDAIKEKKENYKKQLLEDF